MKKLFATLLLGGVMAAAALAVPAQGSAVTITPDAGGAAVHLSLPSDTTRDITSLRLSIAVDAAQPVEVQFAFDDSLSSKIQEYRYDADAGSLNIYLSGNSSIFTEASLDLGQVSLSTPDGKPAQATLRVDDSSIQLLNAAFGTPDQPEIGTVSAEVSVSGSQDETPGTGDDSKPDSDPGNGGNTDSKPESNPGQGGGTSGNGSNSGSSQTVTAQQQTDTPAPPAAPETTLVSPGGTGSSQNTNSGKGTGRPGTSATPQPGTQSTPEPEDTPSSAPVDGEEEETASPAEKPDTAATPEQAEETARKSGSWVWYLVITAVFVAAAAAGLALFFRRRR